MGRRKATRLPAICGGCHRSRSDGAELTFWATVAMVNHGYHRPTMRRWSEIATRIAATTRTSEKVATLADYLRSLSPAELPIAVTYMTGRPFPERDPRTTGIGWAAIAAIVESLVDAPAGALGASYNQSSDLG